MRFAIYISFLAVVSTVSLQAWQRGGNGGGHAVSHGSSFSSHSFSSYHPSTGFTGAPATGFSSVNRGGSAYNSRFRRGFVPNRRVYAPFLYGSYFDPFYSSGLDYGAGGYGYPPDSQGEQTAEVTGNLLGEQLQQLNAQVQHLTGVPYAPPGYYPQGYNSTGPPPNDPAPASAPVMLVLRNGQQLQVQNYAVMGDSFWDFSREPARRIPLSSLDVAASTKATEAGGGEFPAL